jgi:hypothetical protein
MQAAGVTLISPSLVVSTIGTRRSMAAGDPVPDQVARYLHLITTKIWLQDSDYGCESGT